MVVNSESPQISSEICRTPRYGLTLLLLTFSNAPVLYHVYLYIYFKNHNASTSAELSPFLKKRKPLNAETIGILFSSHFSSPRRTNPNLTMIKNKCKQSQIRNLNLQKQAKRLRLKLKSFDDLINKLQQKYLLSENASGHLQVLFKFIFNKF